MVFAPILALLIIVQASLPAKHKRAIIRPRVKKPGLDPTDPASYRPISNLSFISKLVERVIHKQLSRNRNRNLKTSKALLKSQAHQGTSLFTSAADYVESLHLLPPTQSGFRRHHSTETAVIKVYNDIVMALDSDFSTALRLLDFSAAFDCVDHSIFLKVLQLQFGITASALQWISSFLALRSHSVKLSGSSSKIFSVLFVVPQGSILGPLLFILYTSNIVNIASQHGLLVHLYADDTQLYIKLCCKNLENIKVKMVACIHHIQSWCASMRLKLNAAKTELICD